MHKLKLPLPINYMYFLVLKSYLQNKHFFVKIESEYIELSPVNAGVPQGCVLVPLFYLLFSADLPMSLETTPATFAEDTAVIATHNDPAIASRKLQLKLLAMQSWLMKWRMKPTDPSQHSSHSSREEEHIPRFNETVSNSLNQKRSSI
jgi:hypothetical protein